MANDPEEYCPSDWQEEDLQTGLHIWTIFIESARLKDVSTSKPYLQLGAVVEEFPAETGIESEHVGYRFDFRLYLSQKSRVWARYCLSKFGYPEELLKAEPPIIRSAAVQGLHGEVLIDVSLSETMMLRLDVKGFDTLGGTKDLFARRTAILAKKALESGVAPEDTTAAVDLQEDIKKAGSSPEPAQAIDDDPFSAFDQH